jgi:hypothetical protein
VIGEGFRPLSFCHKIENKTLTSHQKGPIFIFRRQGQPKPEKMKMATVTYHQTEDSAATVKGTHHTVVVVDEGNGYAEIMERPTISARRLTYSEDWNTVERYRDYTAAIEFAKLYVDGIVRG